MDSNDIKNYIDNNPEIYFRKARKVGYICPLCQNGTGQSGDGIREDKANRGRYKCFKCDFYGDTIDYIAKEHGLDQVEAWKKALDIYSLQDKAPEEIKTSKRYEQNYPKTERKDFTEFFKEAKKNVYKTDYAQKRGLSRETIERFYLGYVEDWQSPTALERGKNPSPTSRLIIPTSRNSYIARDTSGTVNQYSKMKEGTSELFNSSILRKDSNNPIFVTEGEIDAMSISEVGGEALALGSVTNKKKLIAETEKLETKRTLILLFDNDEQGQKAQAELKNELERIKCPVFEAEIPKTYKDINDMLIADREGLRKVISGKLAEIEEQLKAEDDKNIEEYLKTSAAYKVQGFLDGITEGVDTPYMPTGFKNLDLILDGGLYEGLYFIGAISSLGKTTLTMQIADQVAQQGTDVLIFSLEMAESELMSKSISRLTLEKCRKTEHAKTSRGITTRSRYAHYSNEEIELIGESANAYREYAKHIYIREGIGDIGVERIRESVKQHISFTGRTPLVVIDYLQILAPHDARASDKQNTDKAVLELKKISRDYKIPVLAVSALNRANYLSEINMSAFKESGAIEYSSDVLIGLQLKGVGEEGFDVDVAKASDPREIELKILKNRNGRTGNLISYDFYAKFNYFTEGQITNVGLNRIAEIKK